MTGFIAIPLLFFLNFFILVSYMIFMNGLLDRDVRTSKQIYFSGFMVIFSTVLFMVVATRLGVGIPAAIYVRMLSFVLSYMLTRKVVSWLDW
jgi:hypothetical protein